MRSTCMRILVVNVDEQFLKEPVYSLLHCHIEESHPKWI